MPLSLILSLFLFVNSQNTEKSWGESETGDGIIYYTHSNNNDYTRNGWDYTWAYLHDYYTFSSSCCSANDMIMLIGRNDGWTKEYLFDSGSESMTMNSFTIINTDSSIQHIINTENMKNGMNFYLGCFESTYYSYDNTDYTCRTSIDLDKRTIVDIYSSSFTLFGDNKPEEMEQDYYDIIDQAWKHDVNSRIDINKTIELLDSL
ncbi:hypothetical protein QTN25_008455 [Entamoeba marina]